MTDDLREFLRHHPEHIPDVEWVDARPVTVHPAALVGYARWQVERGAWSEATAGAILGWLLGIREG